MSKNESVINSETDLQILHLNGKVKSLKEEWKGMSGGWSLGLEYEFNDKGYLTKEYKDELGNDEINIKKFKYHSDGQLIEVNQLIDSVFVKKIIHKYTKRGILKEKLVYDENNEYVGKWKPKYDKNFHLIEESFLNTDNKIEETFTYSIDSVGKILEEIHIQGDFYERTNFKYDSLGYLIEQNKYSKDSSNFDRITFIYDSLGNEMFSLQTYPEPRGFVALGDPFESNEYLEYDKYGNWIEKRTSVIFTREDNVFKDLMYVLEHGVWLAPGYHILYSREIEYYD